MKRLRFNKNFQQSITDGCRQRDLVHNGPDYFWVCVLELVLGKDFQKRMYMVTVSKYGRPIGRSLQCVQYELWILIGYKDC